jgi:hypothetical protein
MHAQATAQLVKKQDQTVEVLPRGRIEVKGKGLMVSRKRPMLYLVPIF